MQTKKGLSSMVRRYRVAAARCESYRLGPAAEGIDLSACSLPLQGKDIELKQTPKGTFQKTWMVESNAGSRRTGAPTKAPMAEGVQAQRKDDAMVANGNTAATERRQRAEAGA